MSKPINTDQIYETLGLHSGLLKGAANDIHEVKTTLIAQDKATEDRREAVDGKIKGVSDKIATVEEKLTKKIDVVKWLVIVNMVGGVGTVAMGNTATKELIATLLKLFS